jgi:hypothetical protein
MASLVPSSDADIFSSTLVDLFDTVKRQIVVFKEPQKVFSQTNADYLPGYSDGSQESNVTYVPVSGVYDAQVLYGPKVEAEPMPQTKVDLPQNTIRIKVQQEARDFIRNGRTEYIQVDGNAYNVISDERQQHFFGAVFYYFTLQGTQ